ncbi:protein phosphatase 1 regulatory subunit 3E isoform X1 [Hemiscyllium ocellatum]|uniref:protein phosphatase 1 regulatory subunit 3E isoform X1 n=2 Tax=Hemiscyllium ocellatum TaxID=170820 RepID=UPI002966E69E|nr:protein phosphatase 1 regulatory subunit 3E isoform X1 [Hemiscyllium ocellatum]
MGKGPRECLSFVFVKLLGLLSTESAMSSFNLTCLCPMETSQLFMPRNFSCIAALSGSSAEECALAAMGDSENCKRQGQADKQRSRDGTPSSSSSNKSSSPGQRRRAKSLPAPGGRAVTVLTRASSKKVRFADSLGLELTTIRHFCDAEVPHVPQRVMARLREQTPERLLSNNMMAMLLDSPTRLLEPLFSDPGSSPDFEGRVRRDRVCLESISTDQFSVLGLVRVLNIAYEKQVTVRYTLNHWQSYMDVAATYSGHSADGSTDTFSFKLVAPVFLDTGGTLLFAIRYLVAGREYWDNNKGSDYLVRSHKFKISPPKDWENGWIHFI